MQTAVQELKYLFDDILKDRGVSIAWDTYLTQEKQQIIDAANLKKEDRWFDAKLYNNCGEKYYAETYGSKGSDECHFEQTTNTSSATICKHCGKEKFLHKQ